MTSYRGNFFELIQKNSQTGNQASSQNCHIFRTGLGPALQRQSGGISSTSLQNFWEIFTAGVLVNTTSWDQAAESDGPTWTLVK